MIRNRTVLRLLTAVLLAVMLTACEETRQYDHYEHTDVEGWYTSDRLAFDVPPLSAGTYRVSIGLRATVGYPYRNLALCMETTVLPRGWKKGERPAPDSRTVTCTVNDERGNMTGHTGVSLSETLTPAGTLTVGEGDSLHIELRHIMRRELLPGITDVGLRLERQ